MNVPKISTIADTKGEAVKIQCMVVVAIVAKDL